ncbi:MAG: hypothetical protein HFI38_11865 [Lachnospiraceae bacterium]|jgi:hydrogenase expression/formation protein HypE|nr:hypothetical protein [Lachnospiraceae bacterium]
MEKNEMESPLVGKDLVLAGYMALPGTILLKECEKEFLLQRLPESVLTGIQECHVRQTKVWMELYGNLEKGLLERAKEDPVYAGTGLAAWYPVGPGGILDNLWYMAKKWQTGFLAYLKDIPVRQETIEICEILNINPYHLWSDGAILLAADHGARLCEVLRAQGWEEARVIGALAEGNNRQVSNGETIRFLSRPGEDEAMRYLREQREGRLPETE